MADFVAVLKKTIEGLNDNTPAMREKVYRKARDTVAAKLAAIQPPPPKIVFDRQTKALEDAIHAVEASYMEVAVTDDFESVLAGLEGEAHPDPAAPDAPGLPAEPLETAAGPVSAEPMPAPASRTTGPEEELDEPAFASPSASQDGIAEDLTPVPPSRRPEPALATEGAARRPRRIGTGAIAALIALVVIAAAGYGVWINRDAFGSMFGAGAETAADQPASTDGQQPAAGAEAEQSGDQMASAEPEQPETQAAAPAEQSAAASDGQAPKFTQRLTADGTEIDPGPAGGEQSVGEGTSLASATQVESASASQPAQPAANPGQPAAAAQQPNAAEQAVPVGQRAIFYEERTSMAEGTADNGSTVWSLVQESPGNDLPPEPAIRAEVNIPGKGVQLKMTIRRNADKTLPASHIIEMIFLGNFEGGGIDNVLRIALKGSEAAPGNPLIGIPAKITDGYFLVALSDSKAERDTNIELLLRQSWIDIPIIYRSGRRALVTMEKGVPGDKVFQEAIQAWQNATSG